MYLFDAGDLVLQLPLGGKSGLLSFENPMCCIQETIMLSGVSFKEKDQKSVLFNLSQLISLLSLPFPSLQTHKHRHTYRNVEWL